MTVPKLARTTLLSSLVFAFARSAHADPSPEEKAQADALFRDARALMNQQKVSEACPKFAESQRLDPAPGTLMNLAVCHEQEGKTATAWTEFNDLAERPGSDPARGPFARGRAAELEKKLSKVRIVAGALADGEVVTIDGRRQGTAAFGTPFPIDPGDHAVEATAPGRTPWKQVVQVTPGPVVIDVTVPALAATDAAPPTPKEPAAPEHVAKKSGTPTAKIVGYVAGGAGLVAIGVGSYFGFHTLGKKSDADALCPNNKCAGDPRVKSLDDDAKSSALLSTVFIGVGAAALAAGIVLVLTAPSGDAAPSTAKLRLAPGPGNFSLVGEF